ncbi:hypothetical protein LINPERPRIM_LOCUS21132 [Linum perenne]
MTYGSSSTHFRKNVQKQKIYIMEKFKVMPATGGFRPVQNKLIIQFTSSTTVREIPEMRSIPNYKFSFATEAYVFSNIDESKQLTDAMGAVVHKEDTRVRQFRTKTTTVKNIKLQFTDGYVIIVTLWGPLATEMDKISDVAGDKITILIVSSVWVKNFNGFVYLSTTGASKLYGTKKYPAILKNVDAVTIEQLALLTSDNANKDKVFMVQCIVTGVNYGWSYNGCANDMCLRKIEDVMENYVCGFYDHKMLKTVARYRVSMNVFDSTGTAEFILLDKEGVKYYGIKAEDLLSSLDGIDTLLLSC